MQLSDLRYKLSSSVVRIPVVWFRHINLTSNDVFIASYPRSGSTWLRFVLTEILAHVPASFAATNRLIPQVGYHAHALRLPSGGRFIKTHEQYRSEYKRAIYLVRDPRDVALSEYAYLRGRGLLDCDLSDFLFDFVGGRTNGNGSWDRHVNGWLDSAQDNGQILVVSFEQMRTNPEPTITRILRHLGTEAHPTLIRSALESNSLANMRDKELVTPQKASHKGRFVGSGKVGGWREAMPPDSLRLIEDRTRKSMARAGYFPHGASTPVGSR